MGSCYRRVVEVLERGQRRATELVKGLEHKQPPPSHTFSSSSCPQVAHRQPEEAPQGSPSQASSHHGITLPRVPYPERFRPVASQQAQMGSLGHRVVLPSTSRSRQEQTLHPSPLQTMAPRLPPRSGTAVSSSCRLPPATPAASAASRRSSNWSVGSASSNQRQLPKTAAQLHRAPSYGSRDARPETSQPALHRSRASAPTAKSSGSTSTALHRYSTGSQGSRQQPVARQDPAHSRAARTQARTDTVRAANSSKAPATQPTLRSAGRAPEHLPAALAAGSKGSLKSKLQGLHKKVFPQHLPPLPHIKSSEEPKSSCLPGAPEMHRAPLPPIAPARGSHHSGKQEAAAQGQRQAPAPQTTKAMGAALEATAMSKERNSLALPEAAVQETKQRPGERKDTTKSLHLAIGAMPPAAAESPVTANPQGEHNRTIASPAVHEGEDGASHTEIPGAEAETPELAPGPDKQGDAAASPPAQVSQHPITKAHVAGTRDPEVQEAGASLGLSVAGSFVVLPMTEPLKEEEEVGTEKEKKEEKDQELEGDRKKELSQSEEVSDCNVCVKALVREEDFCTMQDIRVNTLVPELFQAPNMGSQEASNCPGSMGTDAAGEAARDQESVSPAPASPTDTELAALIPATAAEAEQHLTSSAPVLKDHQEEATNAVLFPAADKGEVAASLTEIPGAEAATPELAPGPDKEGNAAASPPAQVSQQPVIKAHVAGTSDPEVQEAGASLGLSVAGRFMVLPMTEPLKEEEEVGTEKEKEEKDQELEGDSKKGLSQLVHIFVCNICINALVPEGDVSTIQDIRANPLVPELFQAPICPGSVGTDVAGRAARHLQSVSSALPGPTHTRLGAPTPAGAAEEEQQDELAGSPASVQDTKEEPGIATLPDIGAAQQQRPSRFRRALKALRRAFCFSCISPKVE
ncbi:uncharacterized protein LOC136019567 [Lathamus discolor]|uniref:uncharacterized protein LOC136019567 n=1 Tax=Lathamus discolor TaxID=678569 RepID=UPI0032B7B881